MPSRIRAVAVNAPVAQLDDTPRIRDDARVVGRKNKRRAGFPVELPHDVHGLYDLQTKTLAMVQPSQGFSVHRSLFTGAIRTAMPG